MRQRDFRGGTSTARAKYTVRAYAVETPSPPQVLAQTNAAFIAQESDPESFTTLAYALLDPEGGRLAFAAAGHPPPLLYRAITGRCTRLDAGGAALGVLSGAAYEEELEPFGPNDVLLLYTDGVLEARQDDEQFGLERLEAAFMAVAAWPAREIVAAVAETAREFAGGTFADDVTLLVLKNMGAETDGTDRSLMRREGNP